MLIEVMKLRRTKKLEVDKFLQSVEFDADTSYLANYPTTDRTFAFLDVTGYTAYTQKYGTHAAAQMLHKFRSAVRIVVGKHGVRVSKWLGDGVMLVGVKSAPLISATAELNLLFEGKEFSIHSGIARGSVIIFEGDDYIGRPVNIASRLADYAKPNEILIHGVGKKYVPNTVKLDPLSATVPIRGIGELSDISRLIVG
jgi:class 3 adenylate cyclase